jgi:anti-sigma factor RsiW
MADAHQRYERLAVGHVVGGLDTVDAARFRSHLAGCAQCRSRVAELRDIASTLTATEREERSTAVGVTEVDARASRDVPPRIVDVAPWRQWPWRAVLLGLAPVLLLLVLAWSVWIRTEAQGLMAIATAQQQTLALLAQGDAVELTTSDGVDAVAAADIERVALFLTGVPELGANEGLVLWLLTDAGRVVSVSSPLLRTQTARGEVMLVAERFDDASEVVVSIEQLPSELVEPIGLRVAAGPLRALLSTAASSSDGDA